jgi:Zn-dependent protease
VFNLPSFRVGRLFGIPLEIDASWFFIFFLVSFTLVTSYFPGALPDREPVVYVVAGVVTALAFFGSLVLHELAHSLVARAGGMRVSKVTLFIFGGVSQMQEDPKRPGHEFVMAAAGPGTSLAIALACFAALGGLRTVGVDELATVAIEYLAIINLALAAFNMLPGYPLDGGRVLHSLLWWVTKDSLKATKWASRAGQVIGMLLIGIAVLGVLRGSFDLVWFAVMGWFISTLAAGAYQQQLLRSRLAEIPVSAAMSTPPILVPAEVTLEEMGHSYFLGGRHTRYPVVKDNRVIGIVDLRKASEIPRDQWASVTAAEVAGRDLRDVLTAPDATVESVLAQLDPDGPGAVLVVDDGRLAGIVTRADVIRLIRDTSASAP